MKEKYILKLKPFLSEKIWGWEKWMLSSHKYGNAVVDNGIYKGKKLSEVLENGDDFPILIKIINAEKTLSVQVHPDDEYAMKNENSKGKTECWYVLEADEGATLVSGIKKGLDKESLSKIINDNKIEECLEFIDIKKGDFIYIPSGTVHAIGGGIKVIEVQQNSNITYRLYDWGRDREVHIEKSIDVIDYEGKNKGGKIENFSKLETPYFTVEKLDINDKYRCKVTEEFHSYTVIEGEGTIKTDSQLLKLNKEETIYIPKGIEYDIEGKLKLIKAVV
ncbi:mannose-6-phosphate isomerase ManA [Clostridium tepidiprofundi DSM 19306]|uniref:Phosphohexomutase n=1 Tax=Clostridium tepidiprofundi DSM 19306 TaxID=1121338 RepID=A0A151B615_9CLOT|nr:type I phosphomannose isomerase catalytic subunit [Clostridium tepidiprofundi]KYH35375.1 mannose-6-phosphate isomerase ManA [Clostridium tepidiprofundi DSM 19306]